MEPVKHLKGVLRAGEYHGGSQCNQSSLGLGLTILLGTYSVFPVQRLISEDSLLESPYHLGIWVHASNLFYARWAIQSVRASCRQPEQASAQAVRDAACQPSRRCSSIQTPPPPMNLHDKLAYKETFRRDLFCLT